MQYPRISRVRGPDARSQQHVLRQGYDLSTQQHKLQLLTEYCQRSRATAVPDPYYGGVSGFEKVLDLVEDACAGVLAALPAGVRSPTARR